MAYEKQQWDTTSFVNPTRMNHIEEGIKANSDEVASLNNDLANTKKDVSDLNSNLDKIISIGGSYMTNENGIVYIWGNYGNNAKIFVEPYQRNIIHSISDKTDSYFGIAFENRDGTVFANQDIEIQILIIKS